MFVYRNNVVQREETLVIIVVILIFSEGSGISSFCGAVLDVH